MSNEPKYGRGPWNDEPDTEDFEHAGLTCRIVRTKSTGALCGYVRVPQSHPLHEVEYNAPVPESLKGVGQSILSGTIGKRGIMSVITANLDVLSVDLLFDVHGSLTFSGELHGFPGSHWYGFDCGHYRDLLPAFLKDAEHDCMYRDIEYVRGECRSLAEQIVKLGGLA